MKIELSEYDVNRVLLAIKCGIVELRLQETEPGTPPEKQMKLAQAQTKWNKLYMDIDYQRQQQIKEER